VRKILFILLGAFGLVRIFCYFKRSKTARNAFIVTLLYFLAMCQPAKAIDRVNSLSPPQPIKQRRVPPNRGLFGQNNRNNHKNNNSGNSNTGNSGGPGKPDGGGDGNDNNNNSQTNIDPSNLKFSKCESVETTQARIEEMKELNRQLKDLVDSDSSDCEELNEVEEELNEVEEDLEKENTIKSTPDLTENQKTKVDAYIIDGQLRVRINRDGRQLDIWENKTLIKIYHNRDFGVEFPDGFNFSYVESLTPAERQAFLRNPENLPTSVIFDSITELTKHTKDPNTNIKNGTLGANGAAKGWETEVYQGVHAHNNITGNDIFFQEIEGQPNCYQYQTGMHLNRLQNKDLKDNNNVL